MGALLKSVLVWALATAVVRIFAALGIGFLTFQGLTELIGSALSSLQSAVGGLSGEIVSILAMAGVFEAMSIGASAFVAIASIKAARVFLGVQQ